MGTVTIDKGTYSSNSAYFYNNGTMTIDNMTFENVPKSLVTNVGNLTINSGTYSNVSSPLLSLGGGETHINGGVFSTGSIILNTYGSSANTFVDGVDFLSSSGRIIFSQGILSLSNSNFVVTDAGSSVIAAIINHAGQLTITNSSVTSTISSISCVNLSNHLLASIMAATLFFLKATINGNVFSKNLVSLSPILLRLSHLLAYTL